MDSQIRIATGISYFGNRFPEHFINSDLPDILAHNCSYVIHTMSEDDLEHYSESLHEMIKSTRDAGLEVYLDPWGLGGVFSGETFSNFLLHNVEAWQVDSNGARVPRACLNSLAFKTLMLRWLDTAVRLGADVIFWDEPHLWHENLPSSNLETWACRCSTCLELYKNQFGETMPERMSPSVASFRQQTIVDFLGSLCTYAKSSGVKNAICLLPFEDAAHGILDWNQIAKIEGLDILGVTPFWSHRENQSFDDVRFFAKKLVSLTHFYEIEPQLWLQGFKIRSGDEQTLATVGKIALEEGIRNVAAWGFRGCHHMSAIRSERPEEVWRVIGDIFRELRAVPQ